MRHRRKILGASLLTLLAVGGSGKVFGQEEPQQQQPEPPPPETGPKPAARSNPLPPIDSGDQQESTNQLQSDDTPLTGMLTPALGTPEVTHSYWAAGVQYAASVQSNGYGSSADWFAYNYVAGNLSLLQSWGHSTLAINYSGGGYFTTESGVSNGAYQVLSLTQSFKLDRWSFQIQDSFSYTPQSSYGFSGGTNLGTPGVGTNPGASGAGGNLGTGLPGIGNIFTPNASLYGGFGRQYYNIGIVQGTYYLSHRTSITASAGYGILNFIDPGFVDTNSFYASIGYNYVLSPKDTIGALYLFSSYHFPGDPQANGNQIASLAYSRKITGRLGLTLYGGPQYTSFRVPIGTATSQLGGYASASLNFATEKGGLSAAYVHGLSGGGGLLVGSTLDQVTINANRSLSRVWSGNVHFGYANNRTVITSSTTPNSSYNSWYAGGGVNRPFGRSVNFGVGYTAGISNYNLSGCPGTTCGPASSTLYQTITVSVQWHTLPMVIR